MNRFCVGKVGNWGMIDWEEGIYPQMHDKLYSQPSKPLSDERIQTLWLRGCSFTVGDLMEFARAIEKEHGIL